MPDSGSFLWRCKYIVSMLRLHPILRAISVPLKTTSRFLSPTIMYTLSTESRQATCIAWTLFLAVSSEAVMPHSIVHSFRILLSERPFCLEAFRFFWPPSLQRRGSAITLAIIGSQVRGLTFSGVRFIAFPSCTNRAELVLFSS